MTDRQLAELLADLEEHRVREELRRGNPLSMSVTIQGHTFDIDGDGAFEDKVDAMKHVIMRHYEHTIDRLRQLGFMIVEKQ